MVITCDGDVEFNYVKNLAYFKDNVKVRSDDGDIDADKITVNLNPTTKKVNDIIAEGRRMAILMDLLRKGQDSLWADYFDYKTCKLLPGAGPKVKNVYTIASNLRAEAKKTPTPPSERDPSTRLRQSATDAVE